jgi:ribose/xylose/arabinose/galactoside ABC-type transport system permease subunit
VIGGVSLAGGRGTVIGAVIGVIIIGVINNGMSVLGADPAVQGIAKGAIIIGAVAIDYLRRRG